LFEVANYKKMMDIQKYLIDIFKRSPINGLPKLNSHINKVEGHYLEKTILNNKFTNVLEIGLAYGISSLYMCNALSKTKGSLISIDPTQKSQFHNYGKKLIKKNKFDKLHRLIEKNSYIALPELLIESKLQNILYDMIFISGWHTFDHTLVDFFYADKLIKIGGYIIIKDIRLDSVTQVIDFLSNNFVHYMRKKSPSRVACFKKKDNDNRGDDVHYKF
jgi:predicted O-methyltransferase YrrM